MNVRFSDAEEFLEELIFQFDEIKDRLVRLTIRQSMCHPLVAWSVVGTALLPDALILKLTCPIGECFHLDAEHVQKLRNEAEILIADIGKKAREVGLIVRAGVYE